MNINTDIQSGQKPGRDTRHEIIQILSTDLLEDNRALVNELRSLARSLNLEFGWHYLLDLVWIITNLGKVDGKRIIDAGAGSGLLQWFLAGKGATVISVDRESRAQLPLRFRKKYLVEGLRTEDLMPIEKTQKNGRHVIKHFYYGGRNLIESIKRVTGHYLQLASHGSNHGCVLIYNQNLSSMPDIGDSSVDAVVAVSALEHNNREHLAGVLNEIYRVLSPGCALITTLCAAKSRDWWHEPSKGWCFTFETLKSIFEFPENISSNYDQYDFLFDKLVNSPELRNNLARFYFKSGNNGMPWGKWDPQYQPVGVIKLPRK